MWRAAFDSKACSAVECFPVTYLCTFHLPPSPSLFSSTHIPRWYCKREKEEEEDNTEKEKEMASACFLYASLFKLYRRMGAATTPLAPTWLSMHELSKSTYHLLRVRLREGRHPLFLLSIELLYEYL